MTKSNIYRRSISIIVILLNVILLTSAVLLYGCYVSGYQERLREENLGNIANLNQSAVMNATALISSWDIKLKDLVRYMTVQNMSYDEALQFINDTNSNEECYFELIKSDGSYKGHLAKLDEGGEFPEVSYSGTSYAGMQKIIDDTRDDAYTEICFTPEFTDNVTARKYFAIYKHVKLKNESGGQDSYTLLLAALSRDVLAAFNRQGDFTDQSTVLIEGSGDYIVSSKDFKSTNFFQYLYTYNELTLDEKIDIQKEMEKNGSGELYYKNAGVVVEDCVFRYERVGTNDWYCITCVPISSFRTPIFNINYALYAVMSVLILFVVDVLLLWQTNRRLRISMIREKEASDAKTDFLSRMSHDIRTPLNGIIGLTTLAMDEAKSPVFGEYLENIKVSGQFLSGLVNDILDMSKVESGKVDLHPEPYTNIELNKYLNAVILPQCVEKGLSFKISPPVNSVPVMLDRLRFNQIIFNLLSNSVKYTNPGGFIEMYWTRRDLEDGYAELEIVVRDNGIGMSEDFQTKMFDSFTQEHSLAMSTGSGLGLTIVKGLVKLMNGRIGVDSKLGVELFEKSKAGFYNAVLMDVMMPEMDGLEATRAIRALSHPDAKTVPIIAMTANAYDTDVKNCLEAGMNTHIGKPVDTEQLKETLSKYIVG